MRRSCAVLSIVAMGWLTGADDPAPKFRVVTPKPEGIIATGLNSRGDLIGFEWVEEEDRKGVIAQMPFLSRGKDQTRIPLLAGYTATFPFGVSDDGVVVGRSSKPGKPFERVPLRNQAFIWDKASGIRGLGTVDGDWASIATAISGDGKVIAGFSIGDNRVRVCVWEKSGKDGTWKATALPHKDLMTSQVVAMSRNGRNVASLDGAIPCLWSRTPDGWNRKPLGGPASMAPRSVNDEGLVVGVRLPPDGSSDGMIWSPTKGLFSIELPKGFVRCEASSVNNKGVVVGMADGPPGSDLGPRAFVWSDGKFRLLDEFRSILSSATVINDAGEISGIIEKDEEPTPAVPEKKAGK